MTRFFNKFGRLAAVAVLAGVLMPQMALAGKSGGFSKNSGGGHSQGSMKSGNFRGNTNASSQPKFKSQFKPNSGNLKPFKVNSPVAVKNRQNGNVLNPTKPGSHINPGVFNKHKQPGMIHPTKGDNVFTPKGKLPKSEIFTSGPITQLPTGPKKPPVLTPFPGGIPPVMNPSPGTPKPKFPPIGPFPGTADPTPGGNGGGAGNPGGGNPGGGNGGNGGGQPPQGPGQGQGNNHGKHNCPWPVFWPAWQGGYGNNSCYYGTGYTTPVYVNTTPQVIASNSAPVINEVQQATPSTGSVDLLLEDVQFIEPATLLVGPAYRVKFRNQGLLAAGKFRLALVAGVDGQANEQSPQTVVEVPGLASGEAAEVTMRLPVAAMKLKGSDNQLAPFTHLLVAADFDNVVIESDKVNNVAIIEKALLEVSPAN